jgi:uncharacterized protein (DUF1697 family)
MDALRGHFSDLGLANVRSYIQTGNVFFDSNDDHAALRQRIEPHLKSRLGYAVPVCLRTVAELEHILSLDPFKDVEVTPDTRLSVTFLAEPSAFDLPIPYLTPKGDYEVVWRTESELFTVWHLQNGRPGSGIGGIEKAALVPTTTRFWHTTAKILQAAQKS